MSQETKTNAMGYARAVYELALEGWQKNLLAVQEKLGDDSNVIVNLDDLQLHFAERKKLLDTHLPSELPEQGRNFLYTLLKDGNLHLLPEITGNLFRLASKGAGAQTAIVTTAIPLDDAEKQQFQTKLAARYGAQLEVEFVVEESIIGGVVVQVGDKILDGSVAAKLNSVHDNLIKAA
ncbi:MAG TPA: ATP synthase F1 subunit delta [Chloroflexi bacterium]|nr:ATP synthase F1 subunit delta [Chloroflexota bacterium]